MPIAIQFFEQLAARYQKGGIPVPRFRGPINAVVRHRPALVGTGARASADLAAYVAEVKKSMYAEAELLSGDATELPLRPLVLYGSPTTSPLVAGLLRDSGWTVDASGIAVGGQRFTGKDLLLIACRPHPGDRDLPVLLYTAASDDLIVNANSVFHGPTDWVVARRGLTGFEVIGKGDFRRTRDGTWRLR
jgi:hypothetical protein